MRNLSEINAPIEHVGNVMTILGLTMTDMGFNDKFHKFKYVAEFCKDMRNVDRFFSRLPKALVPGVDKLSFFYEYCHQKGQRADALRRYTELENQWIQFGEEGVQEEMEAALAEVNDIDGVIANYEG